VSETKLEDLRKEYLERPFGEDSLKESPFDQFRLWFNEAREAQLPEPNAMSLATCDAEGKLSCRTVLLKAFDERGFVFFTNYGSRKAKALASHPQASLLFPWISLERQVEISGKAEKISTAESLAYFTSRPHGSQLGAWVSDQSQVISSRKVLLDKFEELKTKFKEGKVPLPESWGGIRIIPEEIEFWQGAPKRLHDRFRYYRMNEGSDQWQIKRLSP